MTRYQLLSRTRAGDTVVTVVKNLRAPGQGTWVVITQADGNNVIVEPHGTVHTGLGADTRFCTPKVSAVLEYLIEVS